MTAPQVRAKERCASKKESAREGLQQAVVLCPFDVKYRLYNVGRA
jgi:hypothetical protein